MNCNVSVASKGWISDELQITVTKQGTDINISDTLSTYNGIIGWVCWRFFGSAEYKELGGKLYYINREEFNNMVSSLVTSVEKQITFEVQQEYIDRVKKTIREGPSITLDIAKKFESCIVKNRLNEFKNFLKKSDSEFYQKVENLNVRYSKILNEIRTRLSKISNPKEKFEILYKAFPTEEATVILILGEGEILKEFNNLSKDLRMDILNPQEKEFFKRCKDYAEHIHLKEYEYPLIPSEQTEDLPQSQNSLLLKQPEDVAPAEKVITEILKKISLLESELKQLVAETNFDEGNKIIQEVSTIGQKSLTHHELVKDHEKLQDLMQKKNKNEDDDKLIRSLITTIKEKEEKIFPELKEMKEEKRRFEQQTSRINELKREIPKLLKEYQDKKENLAQVQKLAMEEWKDTSNPNRDISEIKKFFKKITTQSSKNPEQIYQELEKYWKFDKKNYEKDIQNLRGLLAIKVKTGMHYQGLSAINREIITSETVDLSQLIITEKDIIQYKLDRSSLDLCMKKLSDPEFLLALFALEAAEEFLKTEKKDSMIYIGMKNNKSITITSMISTAFETPTAHFELEIFPPQNIAVEQYGIEYLPLEDYLKRKTACHKKVLALNEARIICQKKISAQEEVPSLTLLGSQSEYIPKLYDRSNWKKQYMELFNTLNYGIKKYINRGKDISKLIVHAANTPLETLQEEVKSGFLKLLKDSGLVAKEDKSSNIEIDASLEEIAEKISRSSDLLTPYTSHRFDRLHLIAALLEQKKYIKLSDGKLYSNDEILRAVFAQFQKGVTLSNSIAAEQFYTRLSLAYSHFNKFEAI